MESTGVWEYIYEILEAMKYEVKLANPVKTKAIAYAKVKTDSVDASTLADLLRANLVAENFINIFPNSCAFHHNFCFFWFVYLQEVSKVVFIIVKFILGNFISLFIFYNSICKTLMHVHSYVVHFIFPPFI